MSGGEGECAEFVESLADAARQLGVTASTVSRAAQRGGEVGLSPREGIVNIVKDVFLADPRGNHIAQISKDGRAGVRMVPQGGLWAIVDDERDPVRKITESFLHNCVNPIIHSLQIFNSPWSALGGAPSVEENPQMDESGEGRRSLGTYRLVVPARPMRYLPAVPDVSLVQVRPKVQQSRRKCVPTRLRSARTMLPIIRQLVFTLRSVQQCRVALERAAPHSP